MQSRFAGPCAQFGCDMGGHESVTGVGDPGHEDLRRAAGIDGSQTAGPGRRAAAIGDQRPHGAALSKAAPARSPAA